MGTVTQGVFIGGSKNEIQYKPKVSTNFFLYDFGVVSSRVTARMVI